jgi:hypothetical protein
MQSLLLIVGQALEDFVSRLPAGAHVAQMAPPRMAVIEADPSVIARLERNRHVLAGDRLEADPTLVLTPSEHLFLQAWQARNAKTDRIGEGFAWDTEGFSAP